MNECLTTPQHEKQIGYWVSENACMVSVCVCIYVSVRMHVRTYVRMYAFLYVCVCVYVWMYVCVCTHTLTHTPIQVVYFDSFYICATNHELTEYCHLLLHHQTNNSILTACSNILAISHDSSL